MNDQLDLAYIERWVAELGLDHNWKAARDEEPASGV
jgi:hypothetical protein